MEMLFPIWEKSNWAGNKAKAATRQLAERVRKARSTTAVMLAIHHFNQRVERIKAESGK
jgi:hypothetical protein